MEARRVHRRDRPGRLARGIYEHALDRIEAEDHAGVQSVAAAHVVGRQELRLGPRSRGTRKRDGARQYFVGEEHRVSHGESVRTQRRAGCTAGEILLTAGKHERHACKRRERAP